MQQTERSEKMAYKIQTPRNYSEDSIQLYLHNRSQFQASAITMRLYE